MSAFNPAQRDRQVAQLRAAIEVLQALPVVTPCAQCALFDGSGFCARWNALVPEEARAAGCSEWKEGVPF